jgi:Dyp-type peroxidase family
MPEPDLDGADIQADIAPGFRLPHQSFLAVTGETSSIRAIVADLLPGVTRLSEAHAYHRERIAIAKTLRVFGRQSFLRGADGRHLRWLNLALGRRPLEESGIDAPSRFDRSFQLGLAARSLSLGDPRVPGMPGHKDGWIVGRPGQSLDLLILVGSDDADTLTAFAEGVAKVCRGRGGDILYRECGLRLDGDKEHFGFRDGISQPGLRGIVQPEGTPLINRKLLASPADQDPELAAPGEVLIWPGEVLFGYPRQDPNHFRRPLETPDASEPFLRNGSFLVFRRLRQDVVGFDTATSVMAGELRMHPEFAGTDDQWLRANLVGRWPSGAPLQAFPDGDPGDPPGSLDAFNHFLFQKDTASVALTNGEPVGGIRGDAAGTVCPLHAHIRKVNPRDSGTNLGSATHTQQTRILRRGIPYGPPVVDRTRDDGCDRGLLFVSFQRSIREQFEKLAQDWMNSALKPEADRGHDVLVGQAPAEPTGRRAVMTRAPAGPLRQVATTASWILPTGGGYFFCPSLRSLSMFAEAGAGPVVANQGT